MHHAAIIQALGGAQALAVKLGCHRSRTSCWRFDGIPPGRFPAIVKLARQSGLPQITVDTLFAGRELMLRRQPRQSRQTKQPRQACA